MYTYQAKVKRVVDGDTLVLEWLDLGWSVKITRDMKVRLAYINAYETRLTRGVTAEEKAKGIEAREWLKGEIEGKVVRLRSVQGGPDFTVGSFERYLAWVWHDGHPLDTLQHPESLNMEIIRRGWGVPYEAR